MAERSQDDIVKGPHHWDAIERKYIADGPPPIAPITAQSSQAEIVKGPHVWDAEHRIYRPLPSLESASVPRDEGLGKRPRPKQHIEEEVLEEMSAEKRAKVS